MPKVLIFVILVLFTVRARAEPVTMKFERVVPPGAQLTYSEEGTVLKTLNVPPGRVTVVITYNGSIVPGHGGRRGR